MLGRNETQIGHEPAGIREAGDVAEFRHQRRRGYQRQATQRCSAFTTGVSAQSGSAGFVVGFKAAALIRPRLLRA
jgi:hypothetical protein